MAYHSLECICCSNISVTTKGQGLQHTSQYRSLLTYQLYLKVKGNFGQNASLPYRPTWHAAPPDSNFTYVCDGYGSSNVYVFTTDGKWTGRTFGGKVGIQLWPI